MNTFKTPPTQNHHLESVSTSPEFFAQQIFLSAGPISDTIVIRVLYTI